MKFPEEEIAELKRIVPSVAYAAEGGYDYLLLEDLPMPDGCQPIVIDALLCPNARDGYASRLYLATQIVSVPGLNWNGQLHAFDRNWYAISWRTGEGLKLAEMLMIHLKAFRKP